MCVFGGLNDQTRTLDVSVPAEQRQWGGVGGKLTPSIRADLLRRVNPEQTKGLRGFLPLYRGMRLYLPSKDCMRLGVMKGCCLLLEDIVFADDEVLHGRSKLPYVSALLPHAYTLLYIFIPGLRRLPHSLSFSRFPFPR